MRFAESAGIDEGGKHMEISIQVGIKVSDKEKYDMSLNIPTADLTTQTPFKFAVAQYAGNLKDNPKMDNVLQVAFSDKDHVCVLVKPPQSLLETADIGDYVENLQVAVMEGTYNSDKGIFEENGTDNSGTDDSATDSDKQKP